MHRPTLLLFFAQRNSFKKNYKREFIKTTVNNKKKWAKKKTNSKTHMELEGTGTVLGCKSNKGLVRKVHTFAVC